MAEVDIIDLWNKGKSKSEASFDLDIDEVLRKNSKTPLYWIKIILWIEFFINIAAIPLMWMLRSLDFILYAVAMPIVIVLYLIYYQFLIRKINAFDYAQDVKSGLKKLYGYLNFFFLHYKVMIWTSMVFSILYNYFVVFENDEEIREVKDEPTFWIFMLIFVTLFGLLLTWLINLIYGRKIKRLRGIVKELETEEV